MSEEISLFKPQSLKKIFDSELPEYITPKEAHAMIDTAIKENKIRNEVFIKVLWMTGCRISEVVNIKIGDIRNEGLYVLGKRKPRTHKEVEEGTSMKEKRGRIIPLVDALRADLYRYIVEAKLSDDREAKLFPFSTVRGFQIVKEYAKKAGIQRRIYPHMFRHGFAVNFLNNTHHIAGLKEILGHSNIEDTMIYLRITAMDRERLMNEVVF